MLKKKIRIGPYGNGSITITGLTENQIKLFQACVLGQKFVTVKRNGRFLKAVNTSRKPPNPTLDPDMLPFWRARGSFPKPDSQEKLFPFKDIGEHSFPSIAIQSVCGYNYTPEFYRAECKKLKRWGFIQLRSRRELEGRYTEIWYLPGTFCAKEDLLEHIWSQKEKKKNWTSATELRVAVDFLRSNVSFGSLDVVVQRLAMVMDD